MLDQIIEVLNDVRGRTPLVQAITNYVTINDCANILICFGASPAMCEAAEEVEEFAGVVSSLYINLGTLTEEQHRAAVLAARKASECGKPIVLDPVACGAISRKKEVSRELLDSARISVIKGNAGEIKSLAGWAGKVRGVDSLDDGEGAVEACQSLALQYRTVVAMTGKTDIITDGRRTCLVDNGSDMLSLITGSGCMVGALVAAAVAVAEDRLISAAAALVAMGVAAESAAEVAEGLPGAFRIKLFDAVYCLTESEIRRRGLVRWL
jgi:hydroxyethylthiazole kinase